MLLLDNRAFLYDLHCTNQTKLPLRIHTIDLSSCDFNVVVKHLEE